MKKIFLLLIIVSFFGCKSSLMNYALEKKGMYDDKLKMREFTRDSAKIVFFEMAHIGTSLYYEDVKLKIDSLDKQNFYFYLELIKGAESSDSIRRKFIKITGIAFQKEGYMGSLDSIFTSKGIKLKKELISQPKYATQGLTDTNSANVDGSLNDIINYYEIKYQPIILEACDYEVSLYEVPKCPSTLKKEIRDDIILNFRNNHVLENLSKEKRQKIAIIYGKGHLKGITEGLLEMGYQEVVSK
ncbi:hypothetical protein [Flavobacterium tegetincola]|uniref:hypothetical protein n=1 Tax=Flavobacterium tegetincola TaxID=150172 RepID=UPI0004201376|nr:hypothetical protein [Flavobacterium tegetincola]